MVIAIAFIACITFKLKLVGLLGSFLRKKYIIQIYLKFCFRKVCANIAKQKRLPKIGEPFYCLTESKIIF